MEDFENNEQLYRNLISILKLFKNRPYHLAKYLIENNAFDPLFIKKITDSDKLNEIGEDEKNTDSLVKAVYFIDISQMTEYFNSMLDGGLNQSKSDISKDINSKLDQCIKDEKFEEAVRIRDYMSKNKIKRDSNL